MKFQLPGYMAIIALSAAIAVQDTESNILTEDQLPGYFPAPSKFETFEPSGASFAPISKDESVRLGQEILCTALGLEQADLQLLDTNQGQDSVLHMHFSRVINGVKVDNHQASISLLGTEVIARSATFGNAANSFAAPIIAPAKAKITLQDAVKIATEKYGAPQDDFPATNVYLETNENEIKYAHQFQIRNDEKLIWLQVTVDAENGNIVQVVNYYNYATFDAIKLPKITPLDGFDIIQNPENTKASPNGWNSDGSRSFTDTQGNNVDSRIGGSGILSQPVRVDGGSALNFNTDWKATEEPTTESNRQAAIVNNFYLTNMVHDVFYGFGFDEGSGNFQTTNFNGVGKGNDRVQVNNHANGKNNANFATPPDGQAPTMNMYLWDFTAPNRDGSLDSSVPIHEYGHGITSRLTGGSQAPACLRTEESGGLGEGWGDVFASYLTMKGNENRDTYTFALGQYIINLPQGVRRYPYSTNTAVNPLTCKF
jgi:extracellular elastinolytic metalloproteinase